MLQTWLLHAQVNQAIPFIIAGSYPAAVEAHKETGKCLAYNDIDVWYKSLDDEEDGKEGILHSHYESDVFPQIQAWAVGWG